MSQEFLLKTAAAPASPKVETTRGSEQAKKPENKDDTSFSSELDKQIEQHDPTKKIETAENQAEEEPAEKNMDKDESGNNLPDNGSKEDKGEQIEAIELTELDEANLDASIITTIKAEASVTPKTKQETIEQFIAPKVQITVTDEKSTGLPSLNKDSTKFIAGVNTDATNKTDAVTGLELDKKPQTTNLRSDIFHALSKNKSPDSVAVDEAITKLVADKTPERSVAGFSTTLTSTSVMNSIPGQNSVSTQPLLAVQPSLQSSAWNQVLSSRVVWMAREGVQEASLKLNPANLGPVEVKLNMHSDQANVLFISHNAATRDALEQALPRLREAFEQNGMQLADADVTGQESDQTDDEQAGDGSMLGGKGNTAQTVAENEQQAEQIEQNIDVGLSVYA